MRATTLTILDRAVRSIVPKAILTHAPPPSPVAAGLWTMERLSRMPGGLLLPTCTTIAGTGDGLLVISPPPVECDGLEALDDLGAVQHVVVPNAFHHMHARGFLARYPGASLWAAPGLFRRVAGMPPGTELSARAEAPWSAAVDHAVLESSDEISEVALFHRQSATLVLTDLAFNMTSFARRFDRLGWRMNGAPIGFGHSRTGRLLLLRNRPAARSFLERILEWPFRRILVGHGEPVEHDAVEVFRRAFAGYLR